MTLTPSYQQGFAPRDYEPLYPQLWRGCVGAWAPCLGATGTVLRDHSGYGNHGTLTNMDPPNDWVISGGRGALDFDGSNDYANVPNNPNLSLAQNSPITISAWVYTRSNAGYRTILTKRGATTNYELSFMDGDGRLIFYSGGGLSLSTSQVSLNTWTHCAAVIAGSTGGTYYIAGVNAGSATQAVGATNSSALNIGAVSSAFSQYINAQLDDIRIYNRALTESEIRLLASERGIAYKQRSNRRYSQQAATGSRRLKLLTGLP